VIDNRVLRRIFGPKKEEVTGGWWKLHNEELGWKWIMHNGMKYYTPPLPLTPEWHERVSLAVRALDSYLVGPRFESQPLIQFSFSFFVVFSVPTSICRNIICIGPLHESSPNSTLISHRTIRQNII
jgi:hypothetical protein